MKTCIKCNQTKPSTDFYKHNKAKDKLASKCKMCDKAYKLMWAVANKDRLVRYRKTNNTNLIPIVDADFIVYRVGFAVKEDEPIENALSTVRSTIHNIWDRFPDS